AAALRRGRPGTRLAGSHTLPWRPPHGPARGARRSEKMTLGTDSAPRPDSRPHIRETDPEALSARARVGLWVVLVAIAVLAIAVGDHAVHGTLAGASPHMAVGLGVAFLVSVYIAHQLERY